MKTQFLRFSALTVLALGALFLFAPKAAKAASCVSQASGNWNAAATWSSCGAGTPGSADDATILSTHVVTLTQNESVNNITIQDPATNVSRLTGAFTLQVFGTLNSNATTLQDDIINSSVTIKFVGSVSRALFGANWAAGTTGLVFEVALDSGTTGTNTLGTNIKGRTITITSGTFNVSGELRADQGAPNTGTLTIATGGTLIVSGRLSRTSTDNVPFASFTINGNGTFQTPFTSTNVWPSTTPTTFSATSTVRYSGTSQNVQTATYGNLVLSGSGTKTLAGAATLNGTSSSINTAVTLATGAFAFTNNGTLAINSTLTNSGTITNNGSLQINQGGFPGGTGTYAYHSSTGTLVFNNTSGSYGVNNDNYWSTTNGPPNVTVQGAGGITMNVARTISGLFQYAAGVTTANNLTLNGTSQVNAGGFVSGAPTYGSSSLLKYNTGGSYGRNAEWSPGATSGTGYPNNVQLSNNTTLDLPNGSSGSTFQIAGNLTIDSGSTLEMAGGTPMTQALTVLGNVTINGTLRLSSSSGGEIKVASNWTRGASGTFTPNNRSVFFTGSGTQTIAVTGGGTETFNYLIVNKSGGNLTLNSIDPTDVIVNATSGDALQLLNSGGIDLNGRTFTMSGSGGNLLTSGGSRTITGASGSIFSFTGNKTVTSAALGAIRFDTNVLVKISAAVGLSNCVIKNTLQIDAGGSVSASSAPSYDTTSTLKYNSGGSYSASEEWYPNTLSGPGVPQNVQISNNTSVSFGSSAFAHTMKGNLTIDSGASLALSSTFGGDLNIAGNWTNNGTFTPNSRTVTFNGTSAQALNGGTTFDFLTLINSNDLTLNNNITVNQTLNLTIGNISTGTNTLTHAGPCSGNGDVVGTVSRSDQGTSARCFGNTNNQITFAAGVGTPSGNVTVKLTKSTPGGFTGSAVGRYYTITSNTWTGTGTTLRLRYLTSELAGITESLLVLYKFPTGGTKYVEQGGTVNTGSDYVQLTGVSSFSDWAFAASGTPTSIILTSFKAKATDKPSVRVKWETGSEINVVGFNVYRATKKDGEYKLLNDEMLAPLHPGEIIGDTYKYKDKTVKHGKTYFYQLEVVKTDETSEWSEIVKVNVP